MSRVIDRLYISDVETAKDLTTLQELGITHIVNLSDYSNAFPSQFKYHRIRLMDGDAPLRKHVPAAIAFINEGVKSGNVLVHCSLGISRSASIVTAYLMHAFKLSEPDANKFLKQVYPKANPNYFFRLQLLRS